jgi:hypothetical protein
MRKILVGRVSRTGSARARLDTEGAEERCVVEVAGADRTESLR